jgi:hypothetical protein
MDRDRLCGHIVLVVVLVLVIETCLVEDGNENEDEPE